MYEKVKLEKSWELDSSFLIMNLQYFVFATQNKLFTNVPKLLFFTKTKLRIKLIDLKLSKRNP